MGFLKAMVKNGEDYTPAPWGVANELWYWVDSEKDIHSPLPKDCISYRKFDRLDCTVDSFLRVMI